AAPKSASAARLVCAGSAFAAPRAMPRARRAPQGPAPATGRRELADGKAESASCRRCPLWRRATQTVFGAGPADASIVLVGEQPGDQEDLAGHPFIGPFGKLHHAALAAAHHAL